MTIRQLVKDTLKAWFGISIHRGACVDPVYVPRITQANVSRLAYFANLLKLVEDVEGDIVECGVAYGDSVVILATVAAA